MLTDEQSAAVSPICKTILVIFAALVFGPLFFAIIVLFIRFSDEQPAIVNSLDIIAIIGLGMAFLCALFSFIVPRIVLKQNVLKTARTFFGDEIKGAEAAKGLAETFQSSTIIRLALLEGAIFANLMFFMIQGSIFNLVAAAVLLMIMLLAIPLPARTMSKVESMFEEAKFLQKTV